MSKKLVAKISLPNKKQNRKHGSGRGKRNQKPKGRNLVGGFKNAATSLSRVSEGYMPLFPPRTHKWLRYHETVTLTSVAGAINTYVFRANDLFDPNYTGTGHQPMGFDQMMVFYNHFAVNKCRIKVVANNISAATFHVGVRLDGSNTPLTVPDQILEFGGTTYDIVEAKNAYGSSKCFELDVDIARIQGIPQASITVDPNLRGDAATSPVELTYFHIYIWDPLSAFSGSVVCDVTLEYGAFFMEPRDATES